MRKIFSFILCLVLMSTCTLCFAKTKGETKLNDKQICTVYIKGDWMKKGGKVKVAILDNRGWNVRGSAYVYVYDEVNVLMKKEKVTGSKTISLPWKKHKFYTLKFQNAYSASSASYYKSVKWKVSTVLGGNARIE